MIKCRFCRSKKTIKSFKSFNTHGRHFINKEQFQLYFCKHCSSYFISNIKINSKYYSKYYTPHYYSNVTSFISKIIIYTYTKIGYLRFFYKYHHQKLKILDIGCGRGEFLQSLPNNFIKFGAEMNSQGIEICQNLGINVYVGDINKIDFKQAKFDIITLWHVLEHLPDPKKTLKIIYSLLKPSGRLFIAVPNSNSIGFKYGRQNYFHLDSPRHLTIPNDKSIKILLTEIGFSKIRIHLSFFDSPLDLFWSIRKSPLKLIIYPFYLIFKLFNKETILVSAIKNN